MDKHQPQRSSTSVSLILLLALSMSCTQVSDKTTNAGSEVFPAWGDQLDGAYANPIIWADFNNPFVMQHGEDYYMICASHHFMGMPVLHSKDMVNWKLINRIYREIKSKEQYDIPGMAYKKGSWAPTMVYHDGYFIMYVINSTDGLYMTRSTDPAGEWEPIRLIHEVKRWEDPYVYWDDDGEAYFLHSGKRVAPVTIHRMNREGTKILDEGKVILEPNGHNPFIIRKNSYYYLFAAGGKDSQQIAARAENIMGPYETKVVLEKGGRGPSPGGGGYVELDDGTSWFFHHVGIEHHGRMPFLEPVSWEDGWPMMGKDTDGNGIGEPIDGHAKPIPSQPELLTSFYDDFTSPEIGNEWYWNHNPNPRKFETGKGEFTIFADTLYVMEAIDGSFEPVSFDEDDIRRARNTLAFMPTGLKGEAYTRMDFSKMSEGQRGGLAFFGQDYLWLGVLKDGGQVYLANYSNEHKEQLEPISDQQIWLKAMVDRGTGRLAWSLDGKKYQILPDTISFKRQWFENHKIALFTYNIKEPAGTVSYDCFEYEFIPGVNQP